MARDLKSFGGGNVLLSFTGVGHAMGGIDVQKPEFFGSGEQFSNIIFITDRKRSWGNSIDPNLVMSILEPLIENRDVYAIGNSMGGFLSIIFSSLINMKVVVAFVPQFSVNSEIVPDETRWRKYTEKINKFRYVSLQHYFVDRTKYYLFYGNDQNDKRHWEKIEITENINLVVFPFGDHDLASELKNRGTLKRLITEAYQGKTM